MTPPEISSALCHNRIIGLHIEAAASLIDDPDALAHLRAAMDHTGRQTRGLAERRALAMQWIDQDDGLTIPPPPSAWHRDLPASLAA